MSVDKQIPTLYEWAGGAAAFTRLTSVFYNKVLQDPLLNPIFSAMVKEHPQFVAWCLGEVFGGPKTYTEQRGGHRHLLEQHLNRHLTEQQRERWVQLLELSADEAGLPSDPEFRAAFVSYIEWGTRVAVAVSQPGVDISGDLDPMPQWDWIVKPPADSTPPIQDEQASE